MRSSLAATLLATSAMVFVGCSDETLVIVRRA
jgi:hypothetical protein